MVFTKFSHFAKMFLHFCKVFAFHILFAENPYLRVSGGGSTCAQHTPWNTIVVNINAPPGIKFQPQQVTNFI